MFEHMPFFIFLIFVAVFASIIAVFIYGIKKSTMDAKKREKIYSSIKISKDTDIHKYIDILKNNNDLEDKRKKFKIVYYSYYINCYSYYNSFED